MFKVKSRPWPEMVEFYRHLATTQKGQWLLPLLSLVEQIAASDFAGQLYCASSVAVLMVSYLPEFDFHQEVLRINANPKTGLIEFEYRETESPLYKRWRKACPPDEALSVLIQFLKLKKWFPLTEAALRKVSKNKQES